MLVLNISILNLNTIIQYTFKLRAEHRSVLELRYYDRLCSARSLNVYWIIVFKFKIEILLSINI